MAAGSKWPRGPVCERMVEIFHLSRNFYVDEMGRGFGGWFLSHVTFVRVTGVELVWGGERKKMGFIWAFFSSLILLERKKTKKALAKRWGYHSFIHHLR